MKRKGARGEVQCSSKQGREQEALEYMKYVTWAKEVCGVTQIAFRDFLRVADELPRQKRGRDEVPQWAHKQNASVREHAVLLCRVAGLRQAAIADTPAELGGASFASCAALEMDRLLTLTRRQAQEEQEAVPEHLRRKQGFDLRGNDYSGGGVS